MPRRLLTVIVGIAGLLAAACHAQEWSDDARSLLGEGRHQSALRVVRAHLEGSPSDPVALQLVTEIAENLGKYEEADAAAIAWVKAEPKSRDARLVRVRQLLRSGDRAGARALLAPLLAPVPTPADDTVGWDYEATAIEGEVLADTGRDAEAETVFDRLVDDAKRVIVKAPRDLEALARAYRFFGRKSGVKAAERALVEAQKSKDCPATADLLLAELYLDREYLEGDAVEETKAALKKRPGWIAAWLLQGAAATRWGKNDLATQAFASADDIDPDHPESLRRKAAMDLSDFRIQAAEEKLEKATKVNPADKETLSLQACAAYMRGESKRVDEIRARVLAIDPTYGRFYRTIGSVMNERRRWPEALNLLQEAVKLDAKDPALWDDLARYAFCLGHNDLARDAATKADEADAFSHPWRTNTWTLLGSIKKNYKDFTTERFVARLKASDAPALERQILPFLEKSYGILTRKYGYVPDGTEGAGSRLIVEAFARHEDFSVRTLGFKGLGATGVCFGPFIAMLAPNAMKPGEFSWARTFHHEFTHTLTLGLSKGRIPRWLTEGLSTYEEAQFDPSWTRGMDRELFDAYHTGELLKIVDFDAAFRTPRIIYAYYQGGLESEYLVRTYGLEKVIESLRLYAEDRGYDDVFRRAFNTTPGEVDEGFRKFVAERIKPMRMQPRWSPAARERLEKARKEKPNDPELLVSLAWARMQAGALADSEALIAEAQKKGIADPRLKLLEARIAQRMERSDRAKALLEELAAANLEDYDLLRELATREARASRNEEAMKLLRRAIAAFPTNADRDSPRLQLARMLRGGGEAQASIDMLEEHLSFQPEDLQSRRAVLDYYRAKENDDSALAHLEKWVLIDPLDSGIHLQRGEIYRKRNQLDAAALAAQCAIDTAKQPGAEADARVLYAEVLVKQDRPKDARFQLEAALKVAPQHEKAREALDKLGGAGMGDGR